MEPFETTCVLWLPAHPEVEVRGTLRFRTDDGVSADVIGSFDPDVPIASIFEPVADFGDIDIDITDAEINVSRDPGPVVPVLLGVTPREEVTLLQVLRTASHSASTGHASETLSAEILLRGRHATSGFDELVTTLGIGFDALDSWYETALHDSRPGSVEGSLERFSFRWETPPPIEATIGGSRIRLRALISRHNSHRDFRVSLEPMFEISYEQPVPLRDALVTVTSLRWFISLVTRHPARITRVHAVPASDRRSFEVFFASRDASRTPSRHPYTMAVRLNELDLATALPRWFAMVEDLRVPMAMLFGNWFSPQLYGENRVSNAAAAAEALASILYPEMHADLSVSDKATEHFVASVPEVDRGPLRQKLDHLTDPSLRDRLRRLVVDAKPSFDLVVPRPPRWIDALVHARNDIAHGNPLTHNGARLRALSESTEFLIEAHLLMQLGMSPDEVANALRQNPRTEWIADLVRRHLGRAT